MKKSCEITVSAGYFPKDVAYKPCALRKSGIPLGTDAPAPVSTTMRCEFSIADFNSFNAFKLPFSISFAI